MKPGAYGELLADIEEDLAAIAAQISQLQAEADELRVAQKVIRERMGRHDSDSEERSPDAGTNVREVIQLESPQPTPLKGRKDLAIPDAVEIALRNVGHSMRTPEIAEYLLAEGYPYDRGRTRLRESIQVTVNRRIRAGDYAVVRLGPGEYGLTDWMNGHRASSPRQPSLLEMEEAGNR